MTTNPARREALAAFLRARRAAVPPGSVGLRAGSRRRTPGLRREEIAQLAGISATWYTWIEQGRDVSVSPAVLARLAESLQLSRAERAYLFEIAEKRDPRLPQRDAVQNAPDALAASVRKITTPAYVLDRTWTACAWNSAAASLFVGWLDGPAKPTKAKLAPDRNLLRYVFLNPTAKKFIADWDDRAQRLQAEFRADAGRIMEDPPIAALVAELRKRSVLFDHIWRRQTVMTREGGQRVFRHPVDGLKTFEQLTFTFAPRPEFKLVILMPTL